MKSPRTVVSLLVAVTLVALLSGCSKKSTPTGLDTLDQAPPAAPTQLTEAMDLDVANYVLQWTASPSANVASYQVYQYSPSPDRDNAYVLAAETDAGTTQYRLPTSVERTELYYRLRSVSSTGVKSEWSALAKVTVGPAQADPIQKPEPDDPLTPVHH